jgi:hypothetical protein
MDGARVASLARIFSASILPVLAFSAEPFSPFSCSIAVDRPRSEWYEPAALRPSRAPQSDVILRSGSLKANGLLAPGTVSTVSGVGTD